MISQTWLGLARKRSTALCLARAMQAAGVVVCATIPSTIVVQAQEAVSLTPEQVAAIRAQLTKMIATTKERGFIGDELDAALAGSISQLEQTSIALYGAGTAGDVTAAIMGAAEDVGIAPDIMGNGLGAAATAIAAKDSATAVRIAQTIANEGNAQTREAFADSVTNSRGPAVLASTATGSPVVTGSIGSSNTGGTQGDGGSRPPSPPPACMNPSCT